MNQIRQRPLYPKLKEDTRKRTLDDCVNFDGVPCKKHYDSYMEPTLTPGAMMFMCPHMFYIGFHILASHEGQNDPFSTLYTRY